MAWREYTEEQKAKALRLYVEVGPCEAARRTGIPKASIIRWAKAAGFEPGPLEKRFPGVEASVRRAECLRGERNALLVEKAVLLLQRIDRETPPDDCRALATSAAILTDKDQLVSGRPTAREELRHEHHNEPDLDSELTGLLAAMAHREEAGHAGSPAEEAGAQSLDSAYTDS